MKSLTNKIAVIITSIAVVIAVKANAQGEKKTKEKEKKKNGKEEFSSASSEKCFDENSHIINLGLGFGGGNYYKASYGGSYDARRSPAFSISYEQSIKKRIGPGYIGVGAYAGFQTAYYRYNYYHKKNNNYYYYEHRYKYTMIAARGAYHWDILNSRRAEFMRGPS